LLILRQGIEGTAEPAVEGDNLDVTPVETSKPPPVKEPEHVVLPNTTAVGGERLNLFQKLIFFGLIVGIVATYFRLRSRGSASVEKFPA